MTSTLTRVAVAAIWWHCLSTDDDDEESATLKLFRDVTISSEGRYDSNASMRPPDVTGIRFVRRNGIREYF